MYHSVLSVSEKAVDNTPSGLSVNEKLQRENKELNMENTTRLNSDQVTITKNSSVIDDQTLDTAFKTESSDGENDCNRDAVLNCGISQTLLTTSTVLRNDGVDENFSTTADENCVNLNEKPLTENVAMPKENQEMVASKENCARVDTTVLPIKENSYSLETENQSFQDEPLLKANEDTIFDEENVKTEDESETKKADLAAGCSPVMSVLNNNDCHRREKVERDNCWNGNEVMFQSDSVISESNENILKGGGFDYKGEQAQHEELLHEHVLQPASEMTPESSSVTKEPSLQPCGGQTDTYVATLDSLTTSGHNTQMQQWPGDHQLEGLSEHAVKHCKDVTASELTDINQSRVFKEEIVEEAELRMPKVTLTSECESSVNSENNQTVTLDVVNPTSSIIDCENLESENSVSGLGNLMEIIDDKIQVMPEKIEDVSVSVVTELNENAGELEMEQQKTSKKKKTKKDKSKDPKDDKIKSKEKGEKKKKKEKKSVKDKSDKEGNLDSEVKIKEEKKSKTRELSSKQKHKRDLTSHDVDAGKELTANNKRTGGTCSKNNDNDSDDDDDNWESNFDESGDCLNAEHLEEVCFLEAL